MSLYKTLLQAQKEEDVKDAYIKALISTAIHKVYIANEHGVKGLPGWAQGHIPVIL